MNKVICGSDLSNNTHHVSLTDGIRTLGFVVADSRGNCSPLNMHRTPLQTTAIKTVTGTQKYGDFNPHGALSLRIAGKVDEVLSITPMIPRGSMIVIVLRLHLKKSIMLRWNFMAQVFGMLTPTIRVLFHGCA